MTQLSHRRLLLASGNQGKLVELRRFLADLPLRILSPAELGTTLPPVDEDGLTFMDNAVKKAISASAACDRGLLVLADDSGLEVDPLLGAPGVRSARFAGSQGTPAQRDAANNQHLLQLLENVPPERRTARFICVLAVATAGKLVATTHGLVNGIILGTPCGTAGFGYDPLFFHPSSGQTFAQMSPAGKLAVSHRGRALADLRIVLSGGSLGGGC